MTWEEIELLKWQYGVVPGDDEDKTLDVAVGMDNMAEALLDIGGLGSPTPVQCAQVLQYAAGVIRGQREKIMRLRDPNDEEDPLPFDMLNEDESQERCQLCVHRSCSVSSPGGVPYGPGAYCDDPFSERG